jgi:hypothetical protein
MDLQSARKEAQAKSKKASRVVYVNLNSALECEVSETAAKDNENVMAAFSKGNELPISNEPKTTKTNAALAKLSNKARGVTEKKSAPAPEEEQTEPAKVKAAKSNPGKLAPVSADTKTKTNLKTEVMAKGKKETPVKKGKTAKAEKPAKSKEVLVPRGNNMMLTEAQWKKVNAKVGEGSWSGWVRDLVKKAAGITD